MEKLWGKRTAGAVGFVAWFKFLVLRFACKNQVIAWSAGALPGRNLGIESMILGIHLFGAFENREMGAQDVQVKVAWAAYASICSRTRVPRASNEQTCE